MMSGRSSTDALVLREVTEAIGQHSEIPRSVIVTVADGIVTLTGTVAWSYQKKAAARAAADVAGAVRVDNQIQTLSAEASAEVQNRVVDALGRWRLEAAALRIRTDGRCVVLTGDVSSIVAKNEAERAAWRTPGVCEVRNELEVLEQQLQEG